MINFSIIIPFKNEKDNLDELLKSLLSQKTKAAFEIIMIDDFSDDDGCEIIRKYPHIRLFSRKDFPNNPLISSKQNALDIGAAQAKYEYLLFTDADMLFSENWLENYRVSIEKTNGEFIFGRTEIVSEKKKSQIIPHHTAQKAQLDFLFALAFIFCKLGLDGSAMGNNLAISKRLYGNIGGQKSIGFSLIEDKKLLSAARKNGAKIFCTNNFSALAFTKSVSLEKFFLQMLRWVKGAFTESKTLAAALILFAFSNLLILPSFVLILLLFPVYLKNKISILPAFLLPFAFFIETLILIPSLFFVKLKWKNQVIAKPI